MRKLSMHVTVGGHNHAHNAPGKYRERLGHVDADMTRHDVVLRNQSVHDAYRELFGGAIDEYNARQKRADRRIDGPDGYYRKVVADSRGRCRQGSMTDKGKRPVYEAIVGVGSRSTLSPLDEANRELANNVYARFCERFKDEFPRLHVVQAVVHNDEPGAGSHLHLAYIPWGDGYKRGLSRQQSLSRACQDMGFDHKELAPRMRDLLEDVCREFDIGRLDMHNHERHKPLPVYKEEQREINRLMQQAEVANDDADALSATPTDNSADEVSVLRAEVAALRRRNAALEGLIDRASRVIASMAQAVGLLVYDDATPYAAPDLAGRPRRMVEAVSEYAAKWLRGLGRDDLSRQVEDEVCASPGIMEQVRGDKGISVDISR